MKTFLCTLAFVFVFSNSLFAQTEELGVSFYLKGGFSHSYGFKLNNTLSYLGCKQIPAISAFGLFGISYDIKKKVEVAFEGGIGGMGYGEKTRSLNTTAILSAGYILALPKKNRLIFAGNLVLDEHHVYAYREKGNLNFQNPELTNTNMFHLKLYQFMIGPKITWRNELFHVGIGYDFGVVPIRWRSDNLKLSNSPKERIDRFYLSLAFNIATY